MKKSTLILSGLALILIFPAACVAKDDSASDSATTKKPAASTPSDSAQEAWNARFIPRFKGVLDPNKDYQAVITMENGGKFTIEFYPDVAPNHVANFVSLARKGFYDGVSFHRVLPGFMAQGGDPTGTGGGGPGYSIPAEFNSKKHVRGTLSMARTNDPNSAGSQFFICFGPASFLNGQYTVFGQVIDGMDVVDKITPRNPEQYPSFTGDKMKSVEIIEKDKTKAPEASSSKNETKSSTQSKGTTKK